MTKVFVPNIPSRRHPDTGEWIPSINIWSAEKHGDIRVLFTQEEVMEGAKACQEKVNSRIAKAISPGDDWMVLHIGDPAIMAVLIRALTRGFADTPLRLLKWDKNSRSYLLVEVA